MWRVSKSMRTLVLSQVFPNAFSILRYEVVGKTEKLQSKIVHCEHSQIQTIILAVLHLMITVLYEDNLVQKEGKSSALPTYLNYVFPCLQKSVPP